MTFDRARRTITRDPRAGKWTAKVHAKKTGELKMRYFMPAILVADSWESSKGGKDHAIAARVERLTIRLSQLETDFHNQELARERMREAAKGAGPPPSDTESDDSTYMPPQARKQAERAPLQSAIMVMPCQTKREESKERVEVVQRVSVFDRMEEPSTSDDHSP